MGRGPHLRRDCAHIGAGTAPTSAPGLRPQLSVAAAHDLRLDGSGAVVCLSALAGVSFDEDLAVMECRKIDGMAGTRV